MKKSKAALAALIILFICTGCAGPRIPDAPAGDPGQAYLSPAEAWPAEARPAEARPAEGGAPEDGPTESSPPVLPEEDAPAVSPPGSEQTDPPQPEVEEGADEMVFDNERLPEGFSYVRAVNPDIRVDLRYAGTNNFTGFVVDGYLSDQAAILRSAAADALSDVQGCLETQGLGLLVYDAYRPAKASLFFLEWAKSDDERMKESFYPDLKKSAIYPSGYIAKQSAHSRGDTVDLTLVDLITGEALDMGGPFDLFDGRSSHGSALITAGQAYNRDLLKNVMRQFGFAPYAKEWWHYTYDRKKYPNVYYDFDVE